METLFVKITASQYEKALETKRNVLTIGTSGSGKTAIVYSYAKKQGLKVIDYDLAGRLAEEVAGIPVVTKGGFYKRTLDEELEDFFKVQGEGYILFFDEINQGTPETLNTLYRITHPNPEMRKWAGHDISKCQIVACGNMNDGSDGTVYLTDLPTPLLERFTGKFQLVVDNKETLNYLKNKYKNIPQVAKYIKIMLEEHISPRNMDQALDILQYEADPMFLESVLQSEALARKLYDLQKGIKNIDPAELIKNAKAIYAQFKEDGHIVWAGVTITEEKELITKLKEILSDEELASVLK